MEPHAMSAPGIVQCPCRQRPVGATIRDVSTRTAHRFCSSADGTLLIANCRKLFTLLSWKPINLSQHYILHSERESASGGFYHAPRSHGVLARGGAGAGDVSGEIKWSFQRPRTFLWQKRAFCI